MTQKIAVTSFSFSKDSFLRQKLLSLFPNVLFNDKGSNLSFEEVVAMMDGKSAAIVGMEKVDAKLLERLPNLKVISKFGVGLDNIDFEACKKAGVKVVFASGVNAFSVAEQTLGFMIALSRNLYSTSNALRNGQWKKEGGRSIIGKTVGIVGLGHVGKKLVEFLKPFECRILANDIEDRSEFCVKNNVTQVDKETLYRDSDFVSIHTPLTPQTHRMANLQVFKSMKKTAFFINTSRGPVVNEEDLFQALKSNFIAGAALDVYENEPPKSFELMNLDNIICTPHICGNAIESVHAMGSAAIENLRKEYL